MFDIGWSEMAVIALVALIVIGPKDLPKVMRSAAHWARKARSLAREFQSGVDDMIREADLEDARSAVEAARSLDVRKALDETIDPTGALRDEARDIEDTARGRAPAKTPGDGEPKETAPAVAEAQPNIAPPHSLTPPPAAGEPAPRAEPVAPAPAAGDTGTRAS